MPAKVTFAPEIYSLPVKTLRGSADRKWVTTAFAEAFSESCSNFSLLIETSRASLFGGGGENACGGITLSTWSKQP
jgi:hypothetical protein